MLRFVCFLFFSFITSNLFASGSQCTGTVIRVMDHTQQCNGEMAYLTNNSNGKWFCAPTHNGSSIVLAALLSGKKVSSVFDSSTSSTSCDSISVHYIKPVYLHITNE